MATNPHVGYRWTIFEIHECENPEASETWTAKESSKYRAIFHLRHPSRGRQTVSLRLIGAEDAATGCVPGEVGDRKDTPQRPCSTGAHL